MSRFNKDAVYLLNRMTAEKIDAKMRTVRSGRNKYERSWIWELIQNAKDKATIDFPSEKVSILVKLCNNQFTFSHNFGYFTMQNVEGLIRQINTEDKDREDVLVQNTQINPPIGRFGTGFMTTHLLSEKVQVNGLYKDENAYKKVEFSLDRSSTERNELVESVNTSFEQAEGSVGNSQIVSNPNFSNYNTIFTYHLDEYSKKIAQTGLDDLSISLPFTLIFVDGIKQLTIIQGNEQILYEKKEPQTLYNEVQFIEIDKIVNGQVETLNYVFLSKNLTRIALQVEIKSNTFYIKDFAEKLPYIFLHYPLIGTENFYFPVIVNNPFFEPTEPRDGIYLLDDIRDEKSIIDQNFIKEAVDLFLVLLPYAVANNWQSLYNLAKTDLPNQDEDYFAKSWFKSNIQKPIRTRLLESEIVQTETSRILLENALFPYATESKIEKVWQLAKVLHKDKLPKLEHIHEWHKIIDSTWDKDLRYDLKKMVVEIASHNNIPNLMSRVGLGKQETLTWLNDVIEFVVSEDEKLLSDYAIIPNQYEDFKKKENLWADESVPEELKNVLRILKEDWRSSLRHKSIPAYQPTVKKDIDDIVNRINIIITANSVSTIKTAVLDLLSCFPNSNELPKERNKFWNFAKDFYPCTPDKKELENWVKSIAVWDECDKWFMRNLICDISQYQNTSKLTTYLNSDSLLWLHELVIFISNQRFETCLNEYAILPNQKGDFRKKKDLFVDKDHNPQKPKPLNDLKNILELLGCDCRAELLATEIALDIEGKSQTTKEIAQKITERVQQLLREEVQKHRQESTKQVFSKLLLWFHENEPQAEEYFADLYEKRHRLRSDDEIIADIKFRQSLLSNTNGYTEDEILKLVNTPKDKLHILSDEELEQEIQKRLRQINEDKTNKELIDPEKLLVSLGIIDLEELENAQKKYVGTKIGEALQHLLGTTDFSYVHQIIERAKTNVKAYLGTQPNYNISNWNEESFTVIAGVLKNDREVKIVIRPGDNGQIIIYYANEFETLEKANAELWYDNGAEQGIYSFGRLLRRANISRIPL